MASFTNLITLQDLRNVKTSKYIDNPDYKVWKSVRYPEGLVLPKCEIKYRKRVNDDVVEMTAHEKSEKDSEIQAVIDAALAVQKDITQADKIIKALAFIILDELNLLRTKAGLEPRTIETLKLAIISKY